MRPAAQSLSFASPKERNQRKGDPAVCVPALRCGQPAVLASGGVSQNSLRSDSCEPLSASRCAPRRIQKGVGRAIAALGPRRPALRAAWMDEKRGAAVVLDEPKEKDKAAQQPC